MKNLKKLCIFVILSLVLCMALGTVAFATEADTGAVTENGGKLDMDEIPDSFDERVKIALELTVTGMVMIFAVLGVLAIIVSLSKYVLNRDKSKTEKKTTAPAPAPAPAKKKPAPAQTPAPAPAPVAATDDGELAAVITAAIAAMIESGDYKNEFVGGFRVVSFRRTTTGAWNRK